MFRKQRSHDDFMQALEPEPRGSQRRRYMPAAGADRRIDAATANKADVLTSSRIFYALVFGFVLFLITVGILVAVHMTRTHVVPVDALESCDISCPTLTSTCDEFKCLVIESVETCVLTRSTNPNCATFPPEAPTPSSS